MALISCKECTRQFSDLASACPACGAPTAYSSAAGMLSPQGNPQAIISSPPPEQQSPSSVPFVQQIHIQFAEQKEQIRYVGSLLFIGVFFCPVIFYWFLLRQGHTNFARIAGLIWLMISVGWFVFLSYLLFKPDTVPEPAKQAETTQVLQPDEAVEQQFYPLSTSPERQASSATALDDALESSEVDAGMPDTAAEASFNENVEEEPDTTYADNFSECLLAQANTGNYSSSEGNRSAVRMLDACHTDFRAWHNQCVLQIRDEASCSFNASLLAHSALSAAGK